MLVLINAILLLIKSNVRIFIHSFSLMTLNSIIKELLENET